MAGHTQQLPISLELDNIAAYGTTKRRTNTYEDSLYQETHNPYERCLCFFSAFQGLAPSADGLVF
jgi:hypothetical protein